MTEAAQFASQSPPARRIVNQKRVRQAPAWRAAPVSELQVRATRESRKSSTPATETAAAALNFLDAAGGVDDADSLRLRSRQLQVGFAHASKNFAGSSLDGHRGSGPSASSPVRARAHG